MVVFGLNNMHTCELLGYSGIRVFGYLGGSRVFGYSGIWGVFGLFGLFGYSGIRVFGYSGIVPKSIGSAFSIPTRWMRGHGCHSACRLRTRPRNTTTAGGCASRRTRR